MFFILAHRYSAFYLCALKTIPIQMQSKEYRHYRIAVIFSILLTLIVAAFVYSYGKEGSFLIINKYNHPAFDYVFQFWTYLGDGIIWVPLFLYVIALKREFLIAVIASLIICTVLTHVLKRVVFSDELRPILALGEEKIRIIDGFRPHGRNSFPSGHTSTAFTLALLMAFIIRGMFWVFFFPLVAFFVGYSRVYLAQHFVTDVFAGMLIGILSSYLSLLVYEKFKKRKKERELMKTNEMV
jgi:membrane-associated phospholipid phosphatase